MPKGVHLSDSELAMRELQRLLTQIGKEVCAAAKVRLFAPVSLASEPGKKPKADKVLKYLRTKNRDRKARYAGFAAAVMRASTTASGFAEFLFNQHNDDFFHRPMEIIGKCRTLELLARSYPREVCKRAAKLSPMIKWTCGNCAGAGKVKTKRRHGNCSFCKGTGQQMLRDVMGEAAVFTAFTAS